MFLSLEDKGRVASILKNWPERRVKLVCLTDGHAVGMLGDLGVQVGEWRRWVGGCCAEGLRAGDVLRMLCPGGARQGCEIGNAVEQVRGFYAR